MIENIANGIKYKIDDNANLYFNIDDLAFEIGMTVKNSINKTYARFSRINRIMNSIVSTSGHNFGITLPLHKGDYIPETLAYAFLMRLDSKKASEFQIKLAEIASNIRKSGIKVGNEILDTDYENTSKSKKQCFNDAIKNYGKISGKIIGEANKDFVRNYDAKYHTRLNSRIKNYAKKNNKENVSVSDYIDENNLFPNAGKILIEMNYNQNGFGNFGVGITMKDNTHGVYDDGYYHPSTNLKIIAEVTRTANGVKTTCQTLQDDTGKRYFNTKKENI